MKYLYLIFGLVILAITVILSVWFYSDIVYLFTRIINPYDNFPWTPLIRFLATLATAIFAVVYLYYGIKPQRINLLSNFSIILLVLTPIIYLIMAFFSCVSFGGVCPAFGMAMYEYSRIVAILGPALAVVLCLISLFVKKVKQNN